MSRKHPDGYERRLPNRRRWLIQMVETMADYCEDPYEFADWCEYMDELDEVERQMHIRPRKRYKNRLMRGEAT